MTLTNKFPLESKRLYLIPLSFDQLVKYKDLDNTLEQELGAIPQRRSLTNDLKATLEDYLIPYIQSNPSHLLFATIWVIIHKRKKVFVGDIGFNAGPSAKGLVEVGYSTYDQFMNRGYMTEALATITGWAFSSPLVDTIVAQTDKDNFATHKVLAKNGFEVFAEADGMYWWRLDKQ